MVMSLILINPQAQTIRHQCNNCGDVHVFAWSALIVDDTITTPLCPACGIACESFHVRIPDWEVGIGTHPGGLLGHVFPDTGGIVSEHTSGYDLRPAEVMRRLRHRALLAALQQAGLAQVKGP